MKRAKTIGWRLGSVFTAALVLLAPAAFAQNSGFVIANGRHLVLNGHNFYVHGANQYDLFFGSQPMVDEILQDAGTLGLNVIRTWAFCDGAGKDGYCFQPQPRVYDEATFRKLDYALSKANQLNLRLILPLANNWDQFGGMNQYLAWCGSTAGHDDFYQNSCAKALYKDYVQHVLTRVNTYTGVMYKDDPTIMAWELANEPRCESDTSGNTLLAWINEMAAFVKSLDPNHLVATGEEGWYTNKGTDWRHNGSQGVDFLRNSQSASVDVASFHLYPQANGMNEATALSWISEHVADAHQVVGKPVLLGEFGWQVPRQIMGDFATGAETWRVDWGYDPASPQRVATPSYNGNGAIVYTPSPSLPANGSAAGERQFLEFALDLQGTTTLTAWVLVPASAPADMRAVLYAKSGPNWIWREGSQVFLTRGGWTQVSLATSAIFQPTQVRSVGVKIFNGTTDYAGPVYYDLVTAASTVAGQTMGDRNRIYGDWYNRLNAEDADGVAWWLLSGHQDDTALITDFDRYAVYYPEDAGTSAVMQSYSATVADKNTAPVDQPPSVSIQAPSQGATVSGLVTIQATASDDQGVSSAVYTVDGGTQRSMALTGGVWQAAWDSTTVPDGTHTLTVIATDTIGQTGQSPVQVTVRNTVISNAVHVKAISLTVTTKGRKKQAVATVTVVDAQNQAVSGASVSTHWSGMANDSDVTTTDSNGLAKNISSNATTASTGYFTLTVDTIVKSGLTYDPSANVVTSAQVNF